MLYSPLTLWILSSSYVKIISQCFAKIKVVGFPGFLVGFLLQKVLNVEILNAKDWTVYQIEAIKKLYLA